MKEKIVRFILQGRFLWLGLTLLLLGFGGWRASQISFNLTLTALKIANDPEADFTDQFNQKFGQLFSQFVVAAIESPQGLTSDLLQRVDRITRASQEISGVSAVTSLTNVNDIFPDAEGFAIRPLIESVPEKSEEIQALEERVLHNPLMVHRLLSPDGNYIAIYLDLDRGLQREKERRFAVERFEEILEEELESRYPFTLAGVPYVESQYSKLIMQGLRDSTLLQVLIAFIALFIFFRSFALALIPLIISGVSILLTLAVMELLGYSITIVSSAVPPVVMVISIAESTYYIARYLEERGRGLGKSEALFEGLNGVLVASLATSLTTVVGFLSLISAKLEMVRDFGIDLGIGITLSFLVTLFLVPSILSFIPISKSVLRQQEPSSFILRLLARIAHWNEHHTKTIFGVTLSLFIVALMGAPQLELEQKLTEEVGANHPVRQGQKVAEDHLTGFLGAYMSLKSSEPGAWEDPAVLRKIKQIQEKAMEDPSVIKAWSVVDYIEQMNWAFFEGKPEAWKIPESVRPIALYYILMESSDLSIGAKDLLDSDHQWGAIVLTTRDDGSEPFLQLIEELKKYASDLLGPSFEVRFAGDGVLANRGNIRLIKDMIASFLSSFVMVFFVMALIFRSLRLTLLSIPPNILPMLLIIGFMGYVGISLRIGTAIILPVALGIAVNDTIHYFMRYREELRGKDGKDKREAVAAMRRGLLGTGSGMLVSSVVLCLGFLSLLTTEFVALQHMGIAASLTLFVALLADLFLGSALLVRFFTCEKKK
ncbi:MAG: MMPL family transporter [Deltaproteobacteria bacterium]|nr:MMPL family transporter [Deltaproteobacteria bacterium]